MKASTTPFGQWYWRIWVGLLTCGLAFWTIVIHSSLVLEIAPVLFAAILLSLALRRAIDTAARRGLPRGLTVVTAYVVLAASIVLLATMLVPVICSVVSLVLTATIVQPDGQTTVFSTRA